MKTFKLIILMPAMIVAAILTGCAGVTLSSVTTTAETLLGKGAAYVESIANMLYTATPTIITAATDIQQAAVQYGLLPASAQQATTFAKVIAVMNTVGSDAAATKSAVASMQASGIIPTVTTTPTTSSLQWETPKGTVYFTKDKVTGQSLFYSLPDVKVASIAVP